MHEHQSDTRRDPHRPRGDRLEDPLPDQLGHAAAEGRSDVLGATGMLGLQRAAGNAGVTAMLQQEEQEQAREQSSVHGVISSGGRPLDADVRTDMEGRFGADFGDVRVHDGAAAASSARAVDAHAYTVGSNIVFQRDAYDPQSHAGRTTLAHELTHVLQQRSGPVDGTSGPGGIKVSDPSDRFEREASANADRIVSAPVPSAAPQLQREVEPDEEEAVQGLFVQREGEQQADEQEEDEGQTSA